MNITLKFIFILLFLFKGLLASDNTDSKVLVTSLDNEVSINKKVQIQSMGRSSSFFSMILDSSKNGYGGFLETTSPLAYSHDNYGGIDAGWVAVYRQYGEEFDGQEPALTPAGFLGVAQIDQYGELLSVSQRINTKYPEGQVYPVTNTAQQVPLPTADGTPFARYPSAGISSFQNRPTAIWNEYTDPTYGGGSSGGVPMVSFDILGLGTQSNFYSPRHLNTGCGILGACDPPDLWNGNVQYIDGNDGLPRLFALYTSWDDALDYAKFQIRSSTIANGIVVPVDAEFSQQDSLDEDGYGDCLWLGCDDPVDGVQTTGTPDFYINNDGIGYMGMTAFSKNSEVEEPYLHSFFFRKTEDYGVNWTSTGGLKESGYHYIPDAELIELTDSLLTMWSLNPEKYSDKPWYPWAECTDEDGSTYSCGDTISYSDDSSNFFWTPAQFFDYNYDILTDAQGGLHFVVTNIPWLCKDVDNGCDDNSGGGVNGNTPDGIADSIYWEDRYGGVGYIHFYNADPIGNPRGWRATFLEDITDARNVDWDLLPVDDPMTLYTDPRWFFVPNIRASYEDGSEVLWFAHASVSQAEYGVVDTNAFLPTDLDIFMAKSTDNGHHWSVPENVTNSSVEGENPPAVEYGVHLANIGTDNEIGVFYQTPNLDVCTYPVTPGGAYGEGYYDYVNYVNFGIYYNDGQSLATSGPDDATIAPSQFSLKQNYPNPFNPITKISYGIDVASNVQLSLYDIRGRLVEILMDKRIEPGSYDFMLDASHLSSGVYFYTMNVNGANQTKKLILMK